VHENSVAAFTQLLIVGGRDSDCGTAVRDFAGQVMDNRLGVHVDALCRFVEQQHPGLQPQPLGQNHLLLIASYSNEYISRFTVRDGRITRFVECFDSVRLVTGFGGTVEVPAFG
jgi:hypothetical protein